MQTICTGLASCGFPCLFRQLHVQLPIHRVKFRFGCCINIFSRTRVISEMALTRDLLGVFNDSRNVVVYFTSHLVQKVVYLHGGKFRSAWLGDNDAFLRIQAAMTYRLDEPPGTAKFKPAQVAAPWRSDHDAVRGLSKFLERQCIKWSNLYTVRKSDRVVCGRYGGTYRIILGLNAHERNSNCEHGVCWGCIAVVGTLSWVTPGRTLQSTSVEV